MLQHGLQLSVAYLPFSDNARQFPDTGFDPLGKTTAINQNDPTVKFSLQLLPVDAIRYIAVHPLWLLAYFHA